MPGRAIFSWMEINWLGHSCFRIKGNKATIITDPYSPDIGYSLGKPTADIVTVSHRHPGHSYVQGVSGEPRQISGPGEYEIGGVLILGMPAFHDEERGEKRGKNTVYLIEVDGISLCHLGDLGHVLAAEQVEELEDADVLFLPVGGRSTIDASVAAQVVRQLESKIVIPMHYKTEAINRPLDPVDKFLKEMGIKQVDSRPRLSVTRTGLPAGTQVFLLDY